MVTEAPGGWSPADHRVLPPKEERMQARKLRMVVNNPPTREDKQIDRAFRDLSVFLFGFGVGLVSAAWVVAG